MIFSVVALSVLGLSTVAKADTMEAFTYESNGNTFTWQLPASPVPDSGDVYPGFAFALNNVPVSENGGPAQWGVFSFFRLTARADLIFLSATILWLTPAWTALQWTGIQSHIHSRNVFSDR